MKARPTIHDIARAAGVSVATVSKTINGRYGVARSTADKVMRVVEEMGYESSLAASRMRGARTGVIGVLVAEFEPFSAEILKGVGGAAQRAGLDVLAYSAAFGPEPRGWENRSLRRLSGSLIDGAIMVTPTVVATGTEVPIVTVDPHAGPGDLPSTEADSLTGATMAVRYLIELGHRRIGFIAGRPDLRSSRARDTGYRKALAEAGIPFDPRLVRVGFYDQDQARLAAISLLQSDPRPTAVFAANDQSAIGIIQIARELGVDVPGQLSVVGFDDIPDAARMDPPLTTVRQPMRQLGALATDMLVALMDGQALTQRHVQLPTSLVTRATTAPPAPEP